MKPISQLPADINRLMKRGQLVIEKKLPTIVKVEAIKHFEESFDNQGFTDKNLVKWKARKKPRSPKAQREHSGRALMISHKNQTKGTHLKDSFKGEVVGTKVIISTDKPYAEVHNEGGKAGRGKGFTMTARPFMGPSQALDNKIETKLDKEMNNAFKLR